MRRNRTHWPVASYLSRPAQARHVALVRELSRLSRDGWSGTATEEYRPLEEELRLLDRRARSARDQDWHRFERDTLKWSLPL